MNTFLCGLIIFLAMLETINKKKQGFHWKKEGFCALLVIMTAIIVFEYRSGILGCGYHFVDDHEIFVLNAEFGKKGITQTLINSILSDLSIRFRPTYRLIRTLEAFICGTSLLAWHLFHMLLMISTFFLTYVFARTMNCSIWSSLLFTLVSLVGQQSSVIWRLGPQEGIGLLLLMLTLLSLIRYSTKSTTGNLVLSIVATVLLGGIKESFLLLLPILPVFLIYLDLKNAKEGFHINAVTKAFVRRKAYVVATFVVGLVDLSIILFYVGTCSIGYAGIDSSMGIKEYIVAMLDICVGRLNWYCRITGLAVLLFIVPLTIYVFTQERYRFKDYLAILLFYSGVSLYGFGMQLVLYAKSGMFERYLLPTTFLFAFFVIIGLEQLVSTISINPLGYYAIAIILVTGIINYYDIQEYADAYVQEGIDNTAVLETVGENADQGTKILVSLDPELDYSTSIYLQEKFDIVHTYNMTFSENEEGMASDAYKRSEEEREKSAIRCEEADIYVGYLNEIETFMTSIGLQMNDFRQYVFGKYVVYVMK